MEQVNLWMMASRDPKKQADDSEKLGNALRLQLRVLRDQRGWTQAELAKRIGVTRTMIANYEQGAALPPLPVLDKIAQAFEVSLDTLVWGEKRAEEFIGDPKMLELFRQADRLHYRAKAVLMEVIEALLIKEGIEGRLKRKEDSEAA